MPVDFDQFHEQVRPALEQLETQRKILKAKGNRNGLIYGSLVCAVCFIISLYFGFPLPGLIVSVLLGCLVWYSRVSAQSRQLSAYYKKDIIAPIISHLCEGASYKPELGISEEEFMASGLFSTFPDRYWSEDQISGSIGKTAFICSEIVAEEKQVTHDSKGRRREQWIDIFRGFFFMADFHKDFSGHTVVFRNSWLKLGGGKQRVKLENPEFEKRFDIYSTDQVEARYLLTSSMMEKLLELDRKFPGKITVAFLYSHVIVAIPDTQDHFEASIWQSQLKSENIRREFYTLEALFNIIQDLNLNLRIWSKE